MLYTILSIIWFVLMVLYGWMMNRARKKDDMYGIVDNGIWMVLCAVFMQSALILSSIK